MRTGDCAELYAQPPPRVLQISAARKDTGAITIQELKDFAADRLSEDATLDVVVFGAFAGFTASYSDQGSYWREWWLASGGLMIYATYNVKEGRETVEKLQLPEFWIH